MLESYKWIGYGMVGWDLSAGLFYEHRFAMLINVKSKMAFMGINFHEN